MFDLKVDSKQAANIAAEHPEEFKRLRGEYEKMASWYGCNMYS